MQKSGITVRLHAMMPQIFYCSSSLGIHEPGFWSTDHRRKVLCFLLSRKQRDAVGAGVVGSIEG